MAISLQFLKKFYLLFIFIVSLMVYQQHEYLISFYKSIEKEVKPPNILFILADDLGWNDVGYHGSEIRTPTIDRLAAEGVKLENYYVQPACSPSRSQLLTGMYQIHTGMQHSVIKAAQPFCLPVKFPTIADRLKELGYATHMVGKWHLGHYKNECLPTQRGFDTFYGKYLAKGDYYTHQRCERISDRSRQSHCGYDLHDNEEPAWDHNGTHSTELFTQRVRQIVFEHSKSLNSKPLFLYLPYQAVHAPIQAPERYQKLYNFITAKKRRNFAALVTMMDESIANVTNSFIENGLWENTVIIFSSDNGAETAYGGSNYPLKGKKHELWEGGIKSPGFVHSNLLKHKGVILDELMHVSDWFPTLQRLTGRKINDKSDLLDGYDMWDVINKSGQNRRREILHNIDPLEKRLGERVLNDTFDNTISAAIRIGNWKLVTGKPGRAMKSSHPSGTLELEHCADLNNSNSHNEKNIWLYNIMNDPNECQDLSKMKRDIVKKMLDKLQYYSLKAIEPNYPRIESMCNPASFGGVWKPWKY